jgi:hypothetical protein
MVVRCEQVWREISNYLENEVSPELRAAIEAHVVQCKHCTAVLDGTRNVINLYADDRLFELPAGFSSKWHRRLVEYIPRPQGRAYGWFVAVAAVALVSGSFALVKLKVPPPPILRSHHAEPSRGVPGEMIVAVSDGGKTFHVPGCRYLHEEDGVRLVAAAEAIREGYVPCTRCLREYLKR